jgi:hypothetical protein
MNNTEHSDITRLGSMLAREQERQRAEHKADAEKVAHYDAMREQNRLHMIWCSELQEALELSRQQLEGAVEAQNDLREIMKARQISRQAALNVLAGVMRKYGERTAAGGQ